MSATRPTFWTAFLFLLGGDTSCAKRDAKAFAKAALVLLTVTVHMGDLVFFFRRSALLLLLLPRLEPEAGEEDLQ